MTAFKTLVSAAAVGAAAMYVLDPDRGRRRRAIARDKARRFAHRSGDLFDAARRDASHRLHAIGAKARRFTQRQGVPSDEVLVERVRARIGRVVSHPHAVRVAAIHGRVYLSGPILRREHAPLLATVHGVRGVRDINDEALALHERNDGVSALQGNGRRGGARAEFLQDNWTPALRFSAIGGGGLLALIAMRCSPLSRLALTAAGLALVTRGAINVPLSRMLGMAPDDDIGRSGTSSRDDAETADDWSQAAPAEARHAEPGM